VSSEAICQLFLGGMKSGVSAHYVKQLD